ncbi:MAG: hypothetical protein R2823_09510 [Acidimicrobiia bacterium]
MVTAEYLRPIERRVLAMRRDGIATPEIATRFRRSPDYVRRLVAWTEFDRTPTPEQSGPSPIARRVAALRAEGETYEQIGRRFKRSPRFIRQVEGLAQVVHGETSKLVSRGADLLTATAGKAREAAEAR